MSTILMIYYSIFSNGDSFENVVRKLCIFLYFDDMQNIDIFNNSLLICEIWLENISLRLLTFFYMRLKMTAD